MRDMAALVEQKMKTERSSDRDECERAFKEIMGDPSMPDDYSAVYDRWLFDKTWRAALERAAVDHKPLIDAAKEVAATLEPDDTGGVYGPSYQQVERLAAAIRALKGDKSE